MDKSCYLCEIIYGQEDPKIKEIAGSKNFLVVLKEKKDKPKQIIIIPKKPDTFMPDFKEDAEYINLIKLMSEYIHQKLGLYGAKGGAALVPCERGYFFKSSGKRHMCILVYPE